MNFWRKLTGKKNILITVLWKLIRPGQNGKHYRHNAILSQFNKFYVLNMNLFLSFLFFSRVQLKCRIYDDRWLSSGNLDFVSLQSQQELKVLYYMALERRMVTIKYSVPYHLFSYPANTYAKTTSTFLEQIN